MDETAEEAVVRELSEETGLQFSDLKQLHTFSSIDRDPRGKEYFCYVLWYHRDRKFRSKSR